MQILAKISGGFGLRGALNYDFSPCKKTGKPRAELVCGTLQGTPRQICKQAAPLRGLRNIAKPVWRASLNVDPSDGILTAEKWTEICHDFLIGMGLDPAKAAWVAIRHNDHHDDPTPRDHVHLTVLRQQPDGSLFNVSNDVFRSKKVTEQLEIKHQLNKHNREPAQRRAPTVAQQSAFKRTGKMASQQTIQNKVDQVFSEEKNNLSFPTLKEKLRQKRIGIKPKISKGRLMGFSYEDFATGVKMPGSKLGTDYSLGLLTRGLKFDANEVQEEQNPSDKIPEALKPILLPAQYGAKQIKPHAAHQTEVNLDSEKFNNQVVNLQIGPASKVMLLIGGLLAQASVFLIQKILAFLKRLLAAFGFGMRQSDFQKYEHLDPKAPALCYEPTQLTISSPKSAEDKCTDELFRIVESLEKNDPALLPIIEGEEIEKARSEVVAAMTGRSDSGSGASTSTSAESENLDFLSDDFSTESEQTPEKPTESTSQTQADALTRLKTAIGDLVAANKAREAAERDRPGMYFYLDSRDDRTADLTKINKWLDESKTKFADLKAKNKFKFLVGSSQKNELEGEISGLEKLKKAAEIELKKADEAEEKAQKFYRSLPKGLVPVDIFNRINHASAEIKIARKSLHDEAETLLNQLKADPMLGRQTAEIKRNVESNFKNYLTLGFVSTGDFQALSNQILELRRLNAAQENARIAAMADVPDPDGQIVK